MEAFFIYELTLVLGLAIFTGYFVQFHRRRQIYRLRLEDIRPTHRDRPLAQHPIIDDSRCLGCGSCAEACPEGEVLGVIHGKARLIDPAGCVGHGECAKACPVSAITIGMPDRELRGDLPLVDEWQQTTVPRLYICGELGGISLIRNAIEQGKTAVAHIAANPHRSTDARVQDVVIIGAGPAGISAALAAKQHGLSYLVLEQQEAGGTIRHFPRQKLVMNRPVALPLYGKLNRTEYTKEALLKIFDAIVARYQLNIITSQKVSLVRKEKKLFRVVGGNRTYWARHVILALGRRGTPNKLKVPGEELPKVAYQLTDARYYQGNNLLVVGGGDSAVEAAIALARQQNSTVTISYRQERFYRIKRRNAELLETFIASGQIIPIFNSRVREIGKEKVVLDTPAGALQIDNDYVFVCAGGTMPFEMLREAGVTFGGEGAFLATN